MSLEFKSPFTPCVPVAADTLVTPEVWSTDKNANARYLLGMGGASYPKSKTLYVDPVKGFDTGKYAGVRETTLPFRSLSAAVAAAQNGDTIECQPKSAFAVSAGMTLSQNDLTIKFNGSVITTSANLYHVINVTGARVTLLDPEITGNGTPVTGEYGNGLIRVAGANCVIQGAYLHDSTQNGIEPVAPSSSGLRVLNCRIERVKLGIYSTGSVSSVDVGDVLIQGCVIKDVADRGIRFSGTGIAGSMNHRWRNIRLIGNTIECAEANPTAGIELWGGIQNVIEQGNYVYNFAYNISNDRCIDVAANGNVVRAGAYVGIEAAGCRGVNYSGNTIDGLNDDGDAVGGTGIAVSNFFDTDGDSGWITISGNMFFNTGNGGYPSLSAQSQTYMNINGNMVNTAGLGMRFLACDYVVLQGNNIKCTGDWYVSMDFGGRPIHSIHVINNVFSGTTNLFAVQLSNATSGATDGVHVMGNHTPHGNTYPSGVLHVDPPPPTLYVFGNFPKTDDSTTGWQDSVNDTIRRNVLTFTPGATGWYRILLGTSGEFAGRVHITDWTSTTQTDWSLLFTVGAYGGGLCVTQLFGLQSNYNPPSVTKVRAAKHNESTALDIYINVVPDGPINIYFDETDEGLHEAQVALAVQSAPAHNPSTSGWTLSELVLAFNCFNTSTGYAVNGIVVLGSQQGAIADSTATAGSVSTQLNLLLAAARAHGIIAT